MTPRRDPQRKALPFAAWPEPDRTAWRRAVAAGDPFSDAGRGAGWAEATLRRYRWAWGRWLTFLGSPSGSGGNPSGIEAMTPARLEGFLGLLRNQHLAPLSIARIVEALSHLLYAMAPQQDWTWLRLARNRLKAQAVPAKPIAPHLLPIGQIFEKALAVMELAEQRPLRRPLQDSVWFRDGLMLALLAATALRAKNFMGLKLGTHLARTDGGWRLTIPAAEVKNRQPLEGALPGVLTAFLDRYVEHHRPRLAQSCRSDALWITYQGQPMSANGVNRIVKLTQRHLGRRLSAHLFRHCLATSIATDHPSEVLLIRSLLGHTTVWTAERHYNKAQMIDAGRRHAAAIEELRTTLECVADA
jgi:site-specific recombinase XerD